MPLYTGAGDGGTTRLADGSTASKASDRVEAYGTVDEAVSLIGLARATTPDTGIDAALVFIQQRLMNCASILAGTAPEAADNGPRVTTSDVQAVERLVDRFASETPPLRAFVLPGGGECAARLHVARTVLRRAERRAVALGATEGVDEQVLRFLNRASDALFAAARYAATRDGAEEETWDPSHPAP